MDNDQGLALHQLVQSGDELALAKLYDAYSEGVIKVLRFEFSDFAQQDEFYILEAVNEAFLGYYNNPNSFDPSQKTLKNFLIMAAKRDVLNIISRDKKHQGKINLPENVEVEENLWNSIKGDTHSTDEKIVQKESMILIEEELSKHFSDKRDIEMAKMIIQGERETESFAIILQIEELEKNKKQAEVKRNKDRIKKVIDRNKIESKLKNLLQ